MMRYFLLISGLVFGLIIGPQLSIAAGSHKIRVLVEDSPITDFQVRQRINLHLMSSPELTKRLRAKLKSKSTQSRWKQYVQDARPTSKAEVQKLQKKFVGRLQNEARNGLARGLKKKVLSELIDERLQINVAKRENIIISKAMVDNQITQIAKRNTKNISDAEASKRFYKTLASRGVGRSTFREKIKASLAWQRVVRRKFGRDVVFGDRDIEQQMGLDVTTPRDAKTQMKLVRIDIAITSQKDQSVVVQKYVDANAIRQRFSGCSNMKSLVAPYKNAAYVSLGNKTLDQLPSPINVILGDMKVGEITPPQPTAKGLEMYAVCDRKNIRMDQTKRSKVLGKLRQNAFQLRAKRYLSDLRQDAHIEYRD